MGKDDNWYKYIIKLKKTMKPEAALIFVSIALFISVLAFFILLSKYLRKSVKVEIYREFFSKKPVKTFIINMEVVKSWMIDDDIVKMLESYFSLALARINLVEVPALLEHIRTSKHHIVLRNALIVAAAKDAGILGSALARSFNNPNDKKEIELFLSNLPEGERKKQYRVALDILKGSFYNSGFDYPPVKYLFGKDNKESENDFFDK